MSPQDGIISDCTPQEELKPPKTVLTHFWGVQSGTIPSWGDAESEAVQTEHIKLCHRTPKFVVGGAV